MSKSFAIASGKGGVGKSTVTANLGAALSSTGAETVIVDADIGLRSLDAFLSLENRVVYDLIDLANGECGISDCLLSSEAYPHLHLLPASQFSRVKALEPKIFRMILGSLQSFFDYILIDSPAGIERGFRNVVNAGADDYILVVTPDDLSLRSAERALQVIEAKTGRRPQLIVNRLDPALIRNGEMMTASTAAQVLDLSLLGEVPEDPAVYRSQLRHDLCFHYDCEARNAFLRISARLAGKAVPYPAYGTRRPFLLSRIRNKVLKEVIPIDDH